MLHPRLPLLLAMMAAATLRVGAIIPPNDHFATRIPLSGASVSTNGSNVDATREIDEPDPSFQGGRSVWWTWTAPSSGYVLLSTAGSSFDTMLTVFTGNSVSNLNLVAFNDNESNTSAVAFNAVAGTAYQIAVDGAQRATGSISLQLSLGAVQTPPANDNFANRITLAGAHLNNVPGSNLGATAETNEPFHTDNIGLKSVWWSWTAPASGGVTISTAGSTFDTLAAVYTGSSIANLTFVAGNDEDPVFFIESFVTFNAVSNVTYQIAIDGFEGDAGDIRFDLDLNAAFPVPANDNFANRRHLGNGSNISTNGSNVGATFEVGEPMHMLTFGGKTVWYSWTAPSSGGVTLTVSNDVLDTIVAVYRNTSLGSLVFVSGNDENYETVIEGDSVAYFNVTGGTTYQIAVDGYDGTTGNFNLRLVFGSADPVPGNDNFANRTTVNGTNTTLSGSNLGATLEPNEPLHRGYYGGKSVWYQWTAPGPGFVTIDTIGSLADTMLGVYTGSTLADLIEIASDDEAGGNFTSMVTFPTKSGVIYQIAVDGYDGDGFDINLRVRFGQTSYSLTVLTNPPEAGTITINPLPDQGGNYAPGSIVTLSASAGPGATFLNWSGAISSSQNPTVFLMNSSKSITAEFFVIPTTRVWTGGSNPSGNWMTSQNWDTGTPVPGDHLIFPAGAQRLDSNTNNYPANTTFKSITFGGSGYTLQGNALTLTNGLVCTNATGTNTLSLNLTLTTDQTFRCSEAGAQLVIAGNLALGNRTLTAETVGQIVLSGVVSGSGGDIIKTNSGTLSLTGNGANTYTGFTEVKAGTLELGKSGVVAVPGSLTIGDSAGGAGADVVLCTANDQFSSSSAVTVSSSGQLNLNGFNGTVGSLTMTAGEVLTGAGTLSLNGGVTINSSSQSAQISGNLSLAGAIRTFDVANGGASVDLLVPAVIANGSGTGGVTKSGAGTLQLSGASTYSGTSTLNGGTVIVSHSSALGSAAGNTILNSNVVLRVDTSASSEPLTLAGGTLQSDGGNKAWNGNVLLSNTSPVSVSMNSTLSLSGVISGAGHVIKVGPGTLILSGSTNNTYTGTTTLNEGLLELEKNGIAVSGPLIIGDGTGGTNADIVRFTAASQIAGSSAVTINSSGRLDLNGFTGTIGSLNMTSGNVITGPGNLGLNGGVTINSASSPAQISGNLSLQGGTRTFNVGNGASAIDLLVPAVIANGSGTGGLTKTGNGTLQLSGANTYSGSTTLNDGDLLASHSTALGTAAQGTTVNSNATLHIDVAASSEPLTLAGGTLECDGGINSWSGNIVLTNTSLIDLAASTTLNLSGVFSGAGNFTKVGPGTLILSGSANNTHSGAIRLNEGVLELAKTGIAISGPLIIGDSVGGANADLVRFVADSQIAGSAPVTINSSGLLDLNSFAGQVGSLNMTAGHVTTGPGNLGLNGGVTINSASQIAEIAGNLSLRGDDRTFDVANGSASIELLLSATIADGGGAAGVVKSGGGQMQLSAANSYSGLTTINQGTLAVAHSAALGSTTQGAVVNEGATLLINASVINESLTLAGGTLEAQTGSNLWTGDLVLSNTSIADISANALNLSGTISGPGNLTKNGSGMLVLSGASANAYSGLTTVNQGTLLLSKTFGLAVPGALAIGDGNGGADSDIVRLEGSQQIGSQVTVSASGLLNLQSFSNTIGSVSGSGHIDVAGADARLSIGSDNSSSSFDGLISGLGGLTKVGTGTLTLTANNTYSGATFLEGGLLLVNGSQPASAVMLSAPGVLGGTGRVGNVSGTGTVSPGTSPGIFSSGDVNLSSNMTYQVELNGSAAGSGYDQLSVNGTVALAGTLQATLSIQPGANQSFTIIENDGLDPVTGTFADLPEGSVFTVGQTSFQISYAGGTDANDVTLTHVAAGPPNVNSINVLSNGWVHFQGAGSAGLSYVLEATTALEPVPLLWTPIQTNTADLTGLFEFTDSEAPLFPMRFYRVRWP